MRKIVAITFVITSFCCLGLIAQEGKPIEESPVIESVYEEKTPEEKSKNDAVIIEENTSNKKSASNSGRSGKKSKKEQSEFSKKGPYLVASHKKEGKKRQFKVGEKVAYLSKTDKKVMRGIIEEIEKESVKIDGKNVKVRNLVMVKKKFFKTMGWRTVGLSQFALGTGIAAVGVGIAIFSFNQIDPDSPRVIWGAFGTVIGTGVGLVGTHFMLKGSKGMFQSSKSKIDKGWSFSVEL